MKLTRAFVYIVNPYHHHWNMEVWNHYPSLEVWNHYPNQNTMTQLGLPWAALTIQRAPLWSPSSIQFSLFSSSHSVESQVTTKRLTRFGPVSRMHDSRLLKVMMFGQVKGPRCVGLPRNQQKMKKKRQREDADLE